MGVQGINTHTQLSRPLLLSCRIRLPCVGKVDCCRIISGCLKPTNLDSIDILAGIAPPHIRRTVACRMERTRQPTDARHQLFHHRPAASRLKSRKSFMRTITPLDSSASSSRLWLWKDSLTDVPASATWDWRWPSLCRLDLERTGSVGDRLTDCAQGWAVRKQ